MKPGKNNKIASAVSSVSAVGLTLAVMLMNLTGTFLFYNVFAEQASFKEASVFNKSTGYTQTDDEAVNAEIGNISDVQVVPLGSPFGIKLYTDGVIVTSLADINTKNGTKCPAKEAGIEPGDYVLTINGVSVENNQHFTKLLAKAVGKDISMKLRRGDKEFETKLNPVFEDGVFRCGMWIRDSAAGIGTLTFVEPGNMNFAGLGHGICDVDTKQLMSLKDGEPAEIAVCGIEKGEKNNPGKINGYFASDTALGQLFDNSESGIYGHLNTLPQGTAVPLASKAQVQTGPAQILCTVDDEGPQLFDIKIDSIASDIDKPTKNMVLKVTDEKLLNLTGGIIQGMSGSPILQNGKLVGAVTHVFIDDPTMGYGIFAETMYKKLQISS